MLKPKTRNPKAQLADVQIWAAQKILPELAGDGLVHYQMKRLNQGRLRKWYIGKAVSCSLMSIAFISCLSEVCFSQSLVMAAKYPEVSNAKLLDCYMQTSDNRILDLNQMCESSDGDNTKPSSLASGDSGGSGDSDESGGSGSCDNAGENHCEDWAASKLPGVPWE